jgi:6-pyruvoyltetrahydropterin/6-carboxytetrahydropterin synthase
MPWRISKRFRFEAAHRLPNHDGKCARLHGHSWVGWVVLERDELQQDGAQSGMLMDYAEITRRIEPLLRESLDHYYLNESTGLQNPTSEELARWIYERLEPLFEGSLSAIVIEETCTSRAEYWPVPRGRLALEREA